MVFLILIGDKILCYGKYECLLICCILLFKIVEYVDCGLLKKFFGDIVILCLCMKKLKNF